MNIEPITININNVDYNIYESNNQYYCKSTQTEDIVEKINIMLSKLNKKNIQLITDIINQCLSLTTVEYDFLENIDQYYIFSNNIISKYKINKTDLLNNYKIKNDTKNIINIPTQLLLNKKQLFDMLINEIEKINSNLSYSHYIVVNNSDIFNISIRFVYNEGELSNKLSSLKDKYFELNLQLSKYYPFLPPKVSYVKPRINLNLVSNILNLDLWNIKNWNYSITLEWIVTNLGNVLEPLFNKYLELDKDFNFLELKLIELNTITKYINYKPILLELKFTKIDSKDKSSGVGYGTSKDAKWDISNYIDSTKTKNQYIINILTEMNNYIINNEYTLNDQFIEYLLNEINISILEFNNNIDLFKIIINIFDNIESKLNIKYIELFIKNINNLVSSINHIIKLKNDAEPIHFYIDDVYNKYKKYIVAEAKEELLDEKDKYIQMVKEQSCDSIDLTQDHLFYKHKSLSISPKTISRILFELNTLNKDLPINWDSSIVMRIIDSNLNLFSFIITGPKDTPYHNGLFEFHAYIPDGYPNVIPQVLLKTTDNNRVRFNPNLYANGKVCLSLLGTWSGEKGESWIPEISTFYQVLISIQSLILVEQPYFNEPGYERELNTPQGKIKSYNYNDNIRYETVQVAMINMIQNPPKGYEDFISEYFKYKKNEILETVKIWCDESNTKERFEKIYNNLKIILA